MTGQTASESVYPFTLSAANRLFEVILEKGRLATTCGLKVVEMCDHRYLLAELSLIADKVVQPLDRSPGRGNHSAQSHARAQQLRVAIRPGAPIVA